MKDLRHILIFCAFACTLPACAGVHRVMAEPDSVSLFLIPRLTTTAAADCVLRGAVTAVTGHP